MSKDTELRQRIGQHFVFGFHGHTVSDDIRSLIEKDFVGAVILMKRNIRDAKQTFELVQSLQQIAKDAGHSRPLLIGIDQENGIVSAFSSPIAGSQFPGGMTLAAINDNDLAREICVASGKQLKTVGIHWAFAPIADVNSDPRNPVIGTRSFGDDPKHVSALCRAQSSAYLSAGVIPCPKHFPGHGDTNVDSHLALPSIRKSKEVMAEVELLPFRDLFTGEQRVPSVMTAHISLPFVDATFPASLSPAVTTGILREEMGFDGVVVTDCLEMDAIADGTYLNDSDKGGNLAFHVQNRKGVNAHDDKERSLSYTPYGAVLSLKAGADIVMICHTIGLQSNAVERVLEAAKSGQLDLVESAERIARMKDTWVGGWDDVLNTTWDETGWKQLTSSGAEVAKKGYERAVAIIQDPAATLPLKVQGKCIVLTPVIEAINKAVDDAEDEDGVLRTQDGAIRNTAGGSYKSLFNAIRRRVPEAEHFIYSPQLSAQNFKDASTLIIATRNADRGLWQRDFLRSLLDAISPQTQVVVLASCAPYDLLGFSSTAERFAYLASFEYTVPALDAAVKVMFGELVAKGQVPVLEGMVGPSSVLPTLYA